MATIKTAEIESKENKIGRDMGAILAEIVQPGDTIDFQNFISITNSTIDEFVKNFIKKHGKNAFLTLKFVNTTGLIEILIKKALIRRSSQIDSAKDCSSRKNQLRFPPEFAQL